MVKKEIKFLIIVFILLYLIFPIISWNKLLADFEVGFKYAANAINMKGAKIFVNETYWNSFFNIHPPLYVYALAAVFKIFGPTTQAARLFGLLCVITTAFLVYLIFKEIFGHDKEVAATLASLFYISNPLIIQGSLFLDIDNTILTALMMLFTFLYLKWQSKIRLKQFLVLGVILCFIFWCKATTPLVIIAAIFLFQIIAGNIKKSFYHTIVISFLGIGLFIVSLWIYCHITNNSYFLSYIFAPFTLAKDKQLSGTLFFSLLTIFKICLRLTLWLSPFLIVLVIGGLVGIIKKIKQNKIYEPALFLIIYASIIFTVYLYVGGSHIFPKYQVPLMPVLAILTTAALPFDFEKIKIKHALLFLSFIGLMVLYYIYIVRDPILSSNYKLKEAIIRGTVLSSGILKKITLQMIFYILPFCILWLISTFTSHKVSFYKKFIYLLLIFMLSANLGLNVLQAKSNYNHMDHYGLKEEQTQKVLKFIKAKVKPDEEIFAPVDINYFLGRYIFIYTDIDSLSFPEKFMSRLNDKKIKCFVYRITNVSLSQIENVLRNKNVAEKLKRDFQYYGFGAYFIWWRKDG